jgi:two-component system nitrogen regulation response regulator GlnG
MKAIWIVDDDDSIRWVLEKALARAEMSTRSFSQVEEALNCLAQLDNDDALPQVLVSDIRMHGRSGLDLLALMKERYPQIPVIIMTAFSDLDSAVSAFKGGAFEYLAKPFDLNNAIDLIKRAVEESIRESVIETSLTPDMEMLGQAPAMQAMFRMIGRLSTSAATVLITGESGSGKELVARALHKYSVRSQQAFIAINTAAIPKDLLESELFGHERGAFTGAQTVRRGRFEQAEGGTLFLDEIGDMPLDLQTRLLRVLSDGHYYRVGGHVPIKANVRLLAATHQNLEQAVQAGHFREDLFHRLNVIRLRVPSLRERREDIPLLIKFFLQKNASANLENSKRLSTEAIKFICEQDFPGNVRELENLCNWIHVMAPAQVVSLRDLPLDLLKKHSGMPLIQEDIFQNSGTNEKFFLTDVASNSDDRQEMQPEQVDTFCHDTTTGANTETWQQALRNEVIKSLLTHQTEVLGEFSKQFESVVISAALQHTKGRKNEAAQKLGMGRNTIARKIQELGLDAQIATEN